jgi:hypothetical protein
MSPERLSADDPQVQKALGKKGHKYGAKPTMVNGIRYDSRREAARAGQLDADAFVGTILYLQRQPSFDLHVAGVKVCRYVPDFQYLDARNGEVIIEDCKGFRTPLYRLKRKMFEAEYGIQVRET